MTDEQRRVLAAFAEWEGGEYMIEIEYQQTVLVVKRGTFEALRDRGTILYQTTNGLWLATKLGRQWLADNIEETVFGMERVTLEALRARGVVRCLPTNGLWKITAAGRRWLKKETLS